MTAVPMHPRVWVIPVVGGNATTRNTQTAAEADAYMEGATGPVYEAYLVPVLPPLKGDEAWEVCISDANTGG